MIRWSYRVAPSALNNEQRLAKGVIYLNIRKIQPADNQTIKKVIQTSLEKHGLNIPGTAYFDPQLGDLYGYYNGIPNAAYWVVELNGVVVGGIGIAPYDTANSICELQKFYLDDAAQGKGYGKQLMEAALSFAKTHYKQCYLETMHDLKTACILYKKYGFQLLDAPLPGSEHSTMDAWYLKDLTQK